IFLFAASYEVRIDNCGIQQPKKNWHPGMTRCDLGIVIASSLIGDIYSSHMMIVIIDCFRNYHSFSRAFSPSRLNTRFIDDIEPWAPSATFDFPLVSKAMDSCQHCNYGVVNPQQC